MLTDASTIYYPAEIELQILTAVRAGEMEQTVLLLEEIRDKNEQRTLVPEMMRCLQYNPRRHRSLKALSSDDIHKDSMSAAIRLLTMLGHEHLSLEEAFDKLRVLYVQLCLDSMEANQSKNERVMARILDYLQENHADSSLGLDSVAERFGVSYYYLFAPVQRGSGQGLFRAGERNPRAPRHASADGNQRTHPIHCPTGGIQQLEHLFARVPQNRGRHTTAIPAKPRWQSIALTHGRRRDWPGEGFHARAARKRRVSSVP